MAVEKRVHKFATGQPIPEGAVYLSTVTQTSFEAPGSTVLSEKRWLPCWLVWHYFLVEVSS